MVYQTCACQHPNNSQYSTEVPTTTCILTRNRIILFTLPSLPPSLPRYSGIILRVQCRCSRRQTETVSCKVSGERNECKYHSTNSMYECTFASSMRLISTLFFGFAVCARACVCVCACACACMCVQLRNVVDSLKSSPQDKQNGDTLSPQGQSADP